MADTDLCLQLQPLLDRLAAGDEGAVAPLIKDSQDRLRRLAHCMLASNPRIHRWYDTDDVFQASTMRLRRAVIEAKPATVRAFLKLAAACIRRELIDLARHQYGPEGSARRHESARFAAGAKEDAGVQHEHAAKGWGPATEARANDLVRILEASLPNEEREVFDHLYIHGRSQQEAADLLHVSVPTVKRRWRSARLLLAQVLKTESPSAIQNFSAIK
jgi:RNA polymerase sigma-70 factor (ECF subfamily)